MMNIYKVEGYRKFMNKNLHVLGTDFNDAKRVVAKQFGLEIEEVGKCFVINFYASI